MVGPRQSGQCHRVVFEEKIKTKNKSEKKNDSSSSSSRSRGSSSSRRRSSSRRSSRKTNKGHDDTHNMNHGNTSDKFAHVPTWHSRRTSSAAGSGRLIPEPTGGELTSKDHSWLGAVGFGFGLGFKARLGV